MHINHVINDVIDHVICPYMVVGRLARKLGPNCAYITTPNSWDMAMFIPFMKWIFELELRYSSQDQDGLSGATLPSYSTPPYREVWWSRGDIFFAAHCTHTGVVEVRMWFGNPCRMYNMVAFIHSTHTQNHIENQRGSHMALHTCYVPSHSIPLTITLDDHTLPTLDDHTQFHSHFLNPDKTWPS